MRTDDLGASGPPAPLTLAIGAAGRRGRALLSVYPAGLCALTLGLWVAPQTVGPLAVATIFLPHLTLLALLLVPIAVAWPSRPLRWALVALAGIALVRHGPEWVSMPGGPGAGSQLTAFTWNLGHRDGAPIAEVVDALLAADADVVALQELKPVVARSLDEDPRVAAAWPHRYLEPARDASGMGLLSRWPLSAQARLEAPIRLHATATLPDGTALELATAHPYPGQITWVGGRIAYGYDGARRDADLIRIRQDLRTVLATDRPLLLLGDFNVVPGEVGNDILVRGLNDAHAEAGVGPGWTWRPQRAIPLGIGLLRIDRVLSTAALRPLATEVRCGAVGDHCALLATLVRDL